MYSVIALAMTWPLAAGLTRDIPWDLGDSVLNIWILQWGADHWLRFLGGDLGALRGYFHANIFYPEPLTLAYSEHLTAQVLQILPVYGLTGNIVLSYNLLFLSTFVLSGLGTFLLVRELTGQRARGVRGRPALRVRAVPHRPVLAPAGDVVAVDAVRAVRVQALLRVAPRVAARRRRAGARGAELVVRVLPAVLRAVRGRVRASTRSPTAGCGETRGCGRRSARRPRSCWARRCRSCMPYLELRKHGFEARPFEEVMRYSADVYSYLTAHGAQSFWGGIARAFPKPEGESVSVGDARCCWLSSGWPRTRA